MAPPATYLKVQDVGTRMISWGGILERWALASFRIDSSSYKIHIIHIVLVVNLEVQNHGGAPSIKICSALYLAWCFKISQIEVQRTLATQNLCTFSVSIGCAHSIFIQYYSIYLLTFVRNTIWHLAVVAKQVNSNQLYWWMLTQSWPHYG